MTTRLLFAAMITFICATVFAQMCQDWQWMPRPDMNFLSWGYGFFIISGLASIGAGVCFYLEAKKVRAHTHTHTHTHTVSLSLCFYLRPRR